MRWKPGAIFDTERASLQRVLIFTEGALDAKEPENDLLVAGCGQQPRSPEFPLLRVKERAQFYNLEGASGILSRSGNCLVVEGVSLVWPFDAKANISSNGDIKISSAFFRTSVKVGRRVSIGGSTTDAAEVANSITAWENLKRSGCLPPIIWWGISMKSLSPMEISNLGR